MQYKERGQLTILVLKDDEDHVSMERLKAVLLESPSNMIYCEQEGRLAGIISTGDILRAYRAGHGSVAVNKDYARLYYGEYWKAKDILKKRGNINALPVITADHVLIGDYTRWDDLQVLDCLMEADQRGKAGKWEGIRSLALVPPGRAFAARWKNFEKLKEFLRLHHVEVRCIEFPEVFRCLEGGKRGEAVLFVDEDEMRACHTYLRAVFGMDMRNCDRLMTYQKMFEDVSALSDSEWASYLGGLQEKGVRILGLEFRENAYYRKLLSEIEDRFAAVGKKPSGCLPEAMYQDFFDDLYHAEYADGILHMPVEAVNCGGGSLAERLYESLLQCGKWGAEHIRPAGGISEKRLFLWRMLYPWALCGG